MLGRQQLEVQHAQSELRKQIHTTVQNTRLAALPHWSQDWVHQKAHIGRLQLNCDGSSQM